MAFLFPQRLCKISTQTASSSASLSFTTGISSNFTTYYVKVRNLLPATNNVTLLLTFSTNGGSTYLSTNYKYAIAWIKSDGGSGTLSSGSDSSIKICENISSTSTRKLNADIVFYNLNDATYCCKIAHHANYFTAGTLAQAFEGGGMNTGTSAVNAIKFAMSSGNIASGSITLYGCVDGGLLY